MAKSEKIALVTGANKGIGFEVARELARLGRRVFLGARNAKAGRAAAEKLSRDGNVIFIEIDISNAATLGAALETAWRKAEPGDVVLLAPACASFDQFENFEHRGKVFKSIVSQLAQRSR